MRKEKQYIEQSTTQEHTGQWDGGGEESLELGVGWNGVLRI